MKKKHEGAERRELGLGSRIALRPRSCLSLHSYLLFPAFFSEFNLDMTEESYYQDPALSIYPKKIPLYPVCCPAIKL
jgi:hypothetical protein